MTNTTMGSLREVQRIDVKIREIKSVLVTFDERLVEVEEPALLLENELSKLQDRLAQMEADARRLTRSADDKRARAERMDQRLTRVSNLREEAAVRTELDLIKKAIEGDEQEALQFLDQIRRTELQVEELEAGAGEARAQVEPKQQALLDEREAFTSRIDTLESRRVEILESVAEPERRVYESFHQTDRSVVVAPLLEDGACGHCFGVIPLQLQNEIRQGSTLIRCEGCGVILTAEPEPEYDAALDDPIVMPTEVDDATTDDTATDMDVVEEDAEIENE